MLLGVIADDFTGASDVANTLAKGGMRTVQFIGVPPEGAPAEPCDAGVVALKTRSINPAEAVRQSLAAVAWLRAQGCRQFLFKYCSTFDSTPEGNIGPVGEALAEALGARGVVACPAFPATGRRVFQGHLFVQDRLLSESGLERHPLNPMTDPDLRRWLRLQTRGDVGLVAHDVVRRGAEAIRAALNAEGEAGSALAIVDAVADEDLLAIGEACRDVPLLTGGSGIALGLPSNFAAAGLVEVSSPAPVARSGPAVILAGSCSRATIEQVGHYEERGRPALRVEPEALMLGAFAVEDALAFVRTYRSEAPLIYSSEAPEVVAERQLVHGRDAVARAVEDFFARLAQRLVLEEGVERLVVAGGETSGAVVSGLAPRALRIGPEIDPGVPALDCIGAPSVALALKSGNFGAPDFFERAVLQLGGGRAP